MVFTDDDSCTLDPDKDWTEYWRILFKKITLDDIKEFEEKFRGSQEEDEELKNAYIESEVSTFVYNCNHSIYRKLTNFH